MPEALFYLGMLTQNCLRIADLTVDLNPLFVLSLSGYVLFERSEFLYEATSWVLIELRAGFELFSVTSSFNYFMSTPSEVSERRFLFCIPLSSTVT